jgi:hypothetical protein
MRTWKDNGFFQGQPINANVAKTPYQQTKGKNETHLHGKWKN